MTKELKKELKEYNKELEKIMIFKIEKGGLDFITFNWNDCEFSIDYDLSKDGLIEVLKEDIKHKIDEARRERDKEIIKKIKERIKEINPSTSNDAEGLVIAMSMVRALGELIEIKGKHVIFDEKELKT